MSQPDSHPEDTNNNSLIRKEEKLRQSTNKGLIPSSVSEKGSMVRVLDSTQEVKMAKMKQTFSKDDLNDSMHKDFGTSANLVTLQQKFLKSDSRIQLSFKNVYIKVKNMRKRCKRVTGINIIRNISGTVMPGDFVAIIGASGAGKTTLLNFLSGKMISQNLNIRGEVLYNGIRREELDYRSLTAFVMQDDILFQHLSVKECLEFSASLRLRTTPVERKKRVNTLIEQLGLEKCQNTKIGGEMLRGISGGERKRTSIGVQLITDPPVIFLDQPTTGLDSFTAQVVVEILRGLALAGRTVISTIHQPNSDTFDHFDKLMLLARGKIVYMVSLEQQSKNKAKLAVDYFDGIGSTCPEHSNPADYFMKIMSPDYMGENYKGPLLEGEEAQAHFVERIDDFVDEYEDSELRNDPNLVGEKLSDLQSNRLKKSRQVSCMREYGILISRSTKLTMRNPRTSWVKIIVVILNSLMTVALYYNMGFQYEDIQNRNGAFFFISASIGMGAIQNNILLFPTERAIFIRQQSNSMYRVVSYFFGKFVAELPINLLVPCIFMSIDYFLIGFNDNPKNIAMAYVIAIVGYNAASAFALFLSSFISDKSVAVSLTPIIIVPFFLLAGFFVNQSNIPVWLYEFEYLSIFRYMFQAFAINEYDGLRPFNCSLPQCFDPVASLKFTENLLESIIAMVALYVGFLLLAFIVLTCLSKRVQ